LVIDTGNKDNVASTTTPVPPVDGKFVAPVAPGPPRKNSAALNGGGGETNSAVPGCSGSGSSSTKNKDSKSPKTTTTGSSGGTGRGHGGGKTHAPKVRQSFTYSGVSDWNFETDEPLKPEDLVGYEHIETLDSALLETQGFRWDWDCGNKNLFPMNKDMHENENHSQNSLNLQSTQ